MSANKKRFEVIRNAILDIEMILKKLRIYGKNLDLDSEPEPKIKRCVVAVDWDNVKSNLRVDKQFDFAGFVKILVNDLDFKIGDLRLYLPHSSYYELPNNVNRLGYSIEICQKLDEFISADKREDKVDSVMATVVGRFLNFQEITHVVILTHDFHSAELIAESFKQRKKVIIFAYKNKMKPELVELIDILGIPVYSLPSKDKQGF